MNYCEFCSSKPTDDLHRRYHDNFYGFPITADNELFGRLILEINQAGLSWGTILAKENNFYEAFDHFSIVSVAKYGPSDLERLMLNKGIVRNKLKIEAVMYNARQIMGIKEEFVSFYQWLDENHPKTIEEWTKLFKKRFKFVGGEIVREFLMSIGFINGAHQENCLIHQVILEQQPKWLSL